MIKLRARLSPCLRRDAAGLGHGLGIRAIVHAASNLGQRSCAVYPFKRRSGQPSGLLQLVRSPEEAWSLRRVPPTTPSPRSPTRMVCRSTQSAGMAMLGGPCEGRMASCAFSSSSAVGSSPLPGFQVSSQPGSWWTQCMNRSISSPQVRASTALPCSRCGGVPHPNQAMLQLKGGAARVAARESTTTGLRILTRQAGARKVREECFVSLSLCVARLQTAGHLVQFLNSSRMHMCRWHQGWDSCRNGQSTATSSKRAQPLSETN